MAVKYGDEPKPGDFHGRSLTQVTTTSLPTPEPFSPPAIGYDPLMQNAPSSSGSRSPSPTPGQHHGLHWDRKERRYVLRGLVLVIIPPGLLAYYLWIWLALVERRRDEAVRFGIPHENYIFYSWFILGVLALGWSEYGLTGLEAAMLQMRRWAAPNMAALLTHGERSATWTGPGGWFLSLRQSWRLWKKQRAMEKVFGTGGNQEAGGLKGFVSFMVAGLPHKLWWVLASLSMLVYVGIPLTGLVMELGDGFIALNETPEVMGRKQPLFDRRTDGTTVTRSLKKWETGSKPFLPGFGIIYTPPYVDREAYDDLTKVPNAFPVHGDVPPEMFLTAQGEAPISGKAWGLRLSYNCSIAEDVSEFKLLPPPAPFRQEDLSPAEPGRRTRVSGEQFLHYNTSFNSNYAYNLWSYTQLAGNRNDSRENGSFTYDGGEPATFDPDVMDADPNNSDVMEMIMWQVRTQGSYETADAFFGGTGEADPTLGGVRFNATAEPHVRGLGTLLLQETAANGSVLFRPNTTFFNQRSSDLEQLARRTYNVAQPIGLRCRAISLLGYAELNAATSSFRNFERSTPYPLPAENPLARFGALAKTAMRKHYYEIFAAANAPQSLKVSNSEWWERYVTPQHLRRAALLAYAIDALELMYDSVSDFSNGYPNSNLTTATESKVITKGVLPGWVPLIFLVPWAAGCCVLGIIYGFQRRFSDTVDGFTFFQRGVELSEELRKTASNLNLQGGQTQRLAALTSFPAMSPEIKTRTMSFKGVIA